MPPLFCITQVTSYTFDLPSCQPDVVHPPTSLSFLSCQLFCFICFSCVTHIPFALLPACFCIQNELVGVVLTSAWLAWQAAGLNGFDSVELICPAEVQRGFWTFSCLALPGLTELTTLICLKFFVHSFLCS